MQENTEHTSVPSTCHVSVLNGTEEAALARMALGRDWTEHLCAAGMQTWREREAGGRWDPAPRGLQFAFLPLPEGVEGGGRGGLGCGDTLVPFPFLSKTVNELLVLFSWPAYPASLPQLHKPA